MARTSLWRPARPVDAEGVKVLVRHGPAKPTQVTRALRHESETRHPLPMLFCSRLRCLTHRNARQISDGSRAGCACETPYEFRHQPGAGFSSTARARVASRPNLIRSTGERHGRLPKVR